MRVDVLLYLLLGAAGSASADPFALRVRTSTPPTVTTVAETITHFLVPTGYRLACVDPELGDFRDLCSRPIPARLSTQIAPLREFLPTLLPATMALYADPNTMRVVLGHTQGDQRFAEYPAPDPIPTPVDPEPVSEIAPLIAEPIEPSTTKPSPAVVEAEAPIPVPATPEPAASIDVARAFTLQLRPGEALSTQIARQAPPGYQVVWRARTDLLVAASAELEGATFEDSVVAALRALWRTKAPLRVSIYSNNVLVVESL
jgi:hypothetical protein